MIEIINIWILVGTNPKTVFGMCLSEESAKNMHDLLINKVKVTQSIEIKKLEV